jgi:hypothetical protein
VLDAIQAPINIRNNQFVDNGAADMGGAITLDDSSNVRFVNNTVANNVSTGSSENSDGNPHAAGLASEANSPPFQAMLPPGAPDFSNPAALFNNVFWNNDAMTLDQFGPGATLVDQGFIDFEIHGTTNAADTFTPRFSDLTNGQILVPNPDPTGPPSVLQPVPGGQGNVIGVDPGFVAPFVNELTVSGSRLDPQQATVTITGQDPPVGLTGDYHLISTFAVASAALDRGARCSNSPVPANLFGCTGGGIQAPTGLPSATNSTGGGDYDRESRPQRRIFTVGRIPTPWDIGADELPGFPVVLLP